MPLAQGLSKICVCCAERPHRGVRGSTAGLPGAEATHGALEECVRAARDWPERHQARPQGWLIWRVRLSRGVRCRRRNTGVHDGVLEASGSRWGGPVGGPVRVVVDARSRLICAGWLPA